MKDSHFLSVVCVCVITFFSSFVFATANASPFSIIPSSRAVLHTPVFGEISKLGVAFSRPDK